MPERTGSEGWVARNWYGARVPPWLRPAAGLYGAMVHARRLAFNAGLRRRVHPGVPTVVVGNLTAGGTGKTPLVLWLTQQLRARGCRPGIVLRGHGAARRDARLVGCDADAASSGDEAVLLAQRSGVPVAAGVDRPAAARLLVEAGCDTVIADDGLQHLALARDLDIVVVDGARGFGNGALIPAGPLREPASRLHRADLIVVQGEDRHRVVPPERGALQMQLRAVALRAVRDGAATPLEALQGATVHALAGIGHPQRFFHLLRALGATPVEHARPDHHRHDAADLPAAGPGLVVMTEKDAVKCRALAATRDDLYYLEVEATLPAADAARLLDRVLALRRN